METQLTKREQLIERILRLPDEQVEAIAVFVEKLPNAERDKGTRAGIASVPIRKVMELRGLIQVGGDALEDTKRLYD
jgi:hypothetical protein